ncbi:MAG: GyrI-like domain-containing protein [Candidatus Cloacimonetes bacterium]|nr:GyrI-like domain-containing protein [Candidatus Cloacimonadota bacterium]
MSKRKRAMQLKYKVIPSFVAITRLLNLKKRQEIFTALAEMHGNIPDDMVAGADFCIFNFINSCQEGFEVKVGIPVREKFAVTDDMLCEIMPELEVLSLEHGEDAENINNSYNQLYSSAYERGLISDEFCREVYHTGKQKEYFLELQFVIHNWNRLLMKKLTGDLSKEACTEMMAGAEKIGWDTPEPDRFQWLRQVMLKIERSLSKDQQYEIISRCAHVYPRRQLVKLRQVYEQALEEGKDNLLAVDAVIQFMARDKGWGNVPVREGNIVYSTKNPCNPQAFKDAETAAEKRKAYCFCPQIRAHLEEDLSPAYCYCSAGWERQQWETALDRTVRVEVVKSLLLGDDCCQFAIHIPE